MKITKSELKQIIKEEYSRLLNEAKGDIINLPDDFTISEDFAENIFREAFPYTEKGAKMFVKSVVKKAPKSEYRSGSLNWASYTPFTITIESKKAIYSFDVYVTQISKVPEDLKIEYPLTRGRTIKGDFAYAPDYQSLHTEDKELSSGQP